MKFHILALSLFLNALSASSQAPAWGDLGDGTFANPVLNGDFSDPDVIRVGNKFYLTCSEFHFMGMPILESEDMVNWKIISRVHDSLKGYDHMDKYGEGTWAPALRYHKGKYYIYVCSPNEGLWVTTATNPAGPWTQPNLIKKVQGWEDPCPFWDDDNNAYLGRSQLCGGPIYIHKMSPDGMELLDDGVVVYEGPVAEGTKLFKKDGWYYLSIPEGGVSTGWQKVLRADNIYGPYQGVRTLEQGSTAVNGPHQGAYIDTPDGDWWFYHFQSAGVLGRVVHLQPVKWTDGFPQCGTDYDGNGIGEPMPIVTKPTIRTSGEPYHLQTSDDFSGNEIAVQWQFNHNPDFNNYSFIPKPGWLTCSPLKAESLKTARNQLTQKLLGYSGHVSTAIDISNIAPGQKAGLLCIGDKSIGAGVLCEKGKNFIYLENEGIVTIIAELEPSQDIVYLRLKYNVPNNCFQYYWSQDNTNYIPLHQAFQQKDGNWKGARVGLYTYASENSSTSSVSFDYFDYMFDVQDMSVRQNH